MVDFLTRHDEALQTIVGFVLGVLRQLLTWLGRNLQVFVGLWSQRKSTTPIVAIRI